MTDRNEPPQLGVLAAHRRHGIATALIAAGHAWAAELGLPAALDTDTRTSPSTNDAATSSRRESGFPLRSRSRRDAARCPGRQPPAQSINVTNEQFRADARMHGIAENLSVEYTTQVRSEVACWQNSLMGPALTGARRVA
jgi:hypothetical protein